MATILDLVEAGELIRVDPVLDSGVQEERLIYATPVVAAWVQTELPAIASQWDLELSPAEQLDALVATYAEGDVLSFELHFKPLHPHNDGVWELKTPDLRVFGFFSSRDCFVAVRIDTAQRVKEHGLYRGYVGEVVRARQGWDLDPPPFVPGVDPRDVVSNYQLP